MRPTFHFAKFGSLLARFSRDRKGVSAIEFAIILPFMLLLYIGSVELGEGYQVQYQVTDTARTVTDLASQYISLNASTMSSILNASSTIIAPYSNSNLTVTVSQVKVNTGATNGTVYQWSCSLHGTKRSIGSTVALPTNLRAPTSTIYLVYGEVSYPFTPPARRWHHRHDHNESNGVVLSAAGQLHPLDRERLLKAGGATGSAFRKP